MVNHISFGLRHPIIKISETTNCEAKFNNYLRNMAKLCTDMSVLALKKIWDPTDRKYFIQDSERFTSYGYQQY